MVFIVSCVLAEIITILVVYLLILVIIGLNHLEEISLICRGIWGGSLVSGVGLGELLPLLYRLQSRRQLH